MATTQSSIQRKRDTTPQLPLDKYLIRHAKAIYDRTSEKTLKKASGSAEVLRTQQSVTLQRRFRGTTLGDRIGRFSTNEGSLDWLDLDVANLKSLNIVKPTVRANMSSMGQARIKIDCESTGKDPNIKGAAGIGQSLCDYFDLRRNPGHWTEDFVARINQMAQTEYGYALRAGFNQDTPSQMIEEDEWDDEEFPTPGEYACGCGSGGVLDFDAQMKPDGIGLQTTACPECGGRAEVTKEPGAMLLPAITGKSSFNAGEPETIVASSYQIRVDELHSQGGNLDKALYFEYHYLQPRFELEQEHPDIEFGIPDEWSYSLKWLHSLETGAPWNQTRQGSEHKDDDLFEVREIYLQPEKYKLWRSPTHFQFKRRGEIILELAPGERLIDKRPHGCWFKVEGDKLIDLDDTERGREFRKEWSYGGFTPDAHSYWMLPFLELLVIQHECDEMFTIDMQHRETWSKLTMQYNQSVFSAENIEEDFCPTNSGADLEGRALADHINVINPPPMNKAQDGLTFLLGVLPQIGLVQPAAIGAPAPGEPFHAQLLQRQSSLGILSPALLAEAGAKVRHFKNLLRFCQNWPVERFKNIASRFGEEWKEQDVRAFLECDVDTDLDLSYQEGSEIPSSLIEKQIKFSDLIEKLLKIAEVTGNAGLITSEILSQLFQYADADFDVANTEADQRLAQARYERIKQIIESAGNPPNPDAIDQMMMSKSLMPLPKENHKTHVEFYADHQRSYVADPNFDNDPQAQATVVCLQQMIERHEEVELEAAQKEAAKTVAAQQPIIKAQQDAAAQQNEQQGKQTGAQAQLEAAKMAQTGEEADKDRAHEIQKQHLTQAHEAALKSMELQHQTEVAKMQPKGTTQKQ